MEDKQLRNPETQEENDSQNRQECSQTMGAQGIIGYLKYTADNHLF